LYYRDTKTNKIYVANNEDYWYDVNAYIQIIPNSKNELARLWYGWDNFAQGGINSAGLFFDGAATPAQEIPGGYNKPKGNLGDDILALCSSVQEALAYLEKRKVALTNGHIMFGDKNGNAAVVEWIEGQKTLNWISGNKLLMTNFLLSDTTKGNYPCYRYNSIEERISKMEKDVSLINLRDVGNTLGQAVQIPKTNSGGKIGGTLYSTFINITDMEFVLVYKLDNSKTTKLDLMKEFEIKRERKIKLE
jgi:choloylglycine hydrolase